MSERSGLQESATQPSPVQETIAELLAQPAGNLTTPALPRARREWSTRIIALGIGIALIYYGQLFLITLLSSVILAFILEPVVVLVMRLRLPRGFASFLTCSVALLGLYLVGLGAFSQVADLVEDLPTYSNRINQIFDKATQNIEEFEKGVAQIMPRKLQQDPGPSTSQPSTPNPAVPRKRTRTQDPPPTQPPVQEVRIQQPKPNLLLFLYQGVSTIYEPLLMVSFVPFLVYFMLAWRDHMRRAFVGLFVGETKDVAMRTWHAVADMARAYVAGNFMLGLVLAIFSTLFFMLIRLPYPLLLGPISGFLSLVPYVGLPLAVAPPLLAALPVYDQPGAYFIIATTVGFLHLIGLNLLYPKMVGGRVHLNPLAVTVALMFWGLLWGGAGLVLAIPITAGLKAVFDNVTHLKPYGRLLGD